MVVTLRGDPIRDSFQNAESSCFYAKLSVLRNNGITEGFHRKMKLIQRRAYSFKDFENYRLRVRVLCY